MGKYCANETFIHLSFHKLFEVQQKKNIRHQKKTYTHTQSINENSQSKLEKRASFKKKINKYIALDKKKARDRSKRNINK